VGRIEKTLGWCLKKGETRKRKHEGLRRTDRNPKEADKHIQKALHNLKATEDLLKLEYDDWAVSAAFYAMYHASLAILFEFGYESRNQECTFTVLEYLIEKGKINLDIEDIKKIRSVGEVVPEPNAKSFREEMQYGTETKASKILLERMTKDSKDFVQKARGVLLQLRGEI
jgi:uncharacterized protein (UPF0332 family)